MLVFPEEVQEQRSNTLQVLGPERRVTISIRYRNRSYFLCFFLSLIHAVIASSYSLCLLQINFWLSGFPRLWTCITTSYMHHCSHQIIDRECKKLGFTSNMKACQQCLRISPCSICWEKDNMGPGDAFQKGFAGHRKVTRLSSFWLLTDKNKTTK